MNQPLFNFNTAYRTKQTLFTAVWNGLAKQGFKRSVRDDGLCKYAGPNETGCAVGVLLPRDVAKSLDRTATTTAIEDLIARGIVRASKEKSNLLDACQLAHDHGITPAEMQEELRKVAKQFGLTVPGEVGK